MSARSIFQQVLITLVAMRTLNAVAGQFPATRQVIKGETPFFQRLLGN